MDPESIPDNPYLLLTPGPLSTTKRVRATLLRDWCTWDDDYNRLVERVRKGLVELAGDPTEYSSVLMQGSGTFSVESAIGSMMPRVGGRLLLVVNGAYGQRMAEIARYLGIDHLVLDSGEQERPDLDRLAETLAHDVAISHVAVVHCETTTGMLNPIDEIGRIVKASGRTFLVDAMSSFGGIPIDLHDVGIDFLVSSANKCIQGVPGFGFIIARRAAMTACEGNARSLSLDMYQQWRAMEDGGGKWRFTSPTHTVRAFAEAMEELKAEGGVEARHRRYRSNHDLLVAGMQDLGFECLLPAAYQSPIITSFLSPHNPAYDFKRFYDDLKHAGFVIYPGKVTGVDTFRIGNIGDIHPSDIERLLEAVAAARVW
jgi:2-aminoethylphosphonate-pyruvate transaminase